ncbi:hypothetical protein SD70_12010 [Gordoniibacillus kamchatkensis]|uniref:Transposase n=1 Tax=Gordoniibacillus kamchatkensis TaxID=1590651 RepID=A0ABR5AIS6_9BACL|nr:hypothetical protein SD70_12010 [Paenibacillus sp. VKM B-2647]
MTLMIDHSILGHVDKAIYRWIYADPPPKKFQSFFAPQRNFLRTVAFNTLKFQHEVTRHLEQIHKIISLLDLLTIV